MGSEIASYILWRVTVVLVVSCLLFIATFLGSISAYNFTKGQIYHHLKSRPKHFFLRSFLIS
ncbi:MAG: hypothetical protein KDF65_08145, partial [Anaerolineae bacterium]|nr:hypothetical protein [Anaerolineae bacterium]